MQMDIQSRPRPAEGVVWREGETSVLLLNPSDGRYFALEDSGGRIWTLCDGSRSIAEIARVLHEEYDAPLDAVEADVLELIVELVDEKLLDAA